MFGYCKTERFVLLSCVKNTWPSECFTEIVQNAKDTTVKLILRQLTLNTMTAEL